MINYLKRNMNLIFLFSCIGFFIGTIYSIMISGFSVLYSGKTELLGLIIIFAGMLVLIAEITKEALNKKYYDSEQIEEELQAPVLGSIPWLDQEVYDEPDIMFAIDEAASAYSLAYQKAVSCLKLKANKTNKRIFAFTSAEFSKIRSTIIMNVAYSLSRTGESVIVVDADFRTPSIGSELGLKLDSRGDLSGILRGSVKDADVYTYSIPGINNFYIIPNSSNSADPSLYLYSKRFKQLVHDLRLKYDWVFIDLPPALAVPDILMVSEEVDGVILVSGLETEKSALKAISRQLKTYGIDLFGVITREFQTKEAASANVYIRQMISNLMAENESLIPE